MSDPLPTLIELLSGYEARQLEKRAKSLIEPEYIYETSIVVLGRKRNATAKHQTFSKEDKESKFKEAKNKCQWCHKLITGKWHAHHIIPKSKGGTNAPENLMVLHPECHNNPLIFEILHPGIVIPKAFNATNWEIS
jgi:hypothetical protein